VPPLSVIKGSLDKVAFSKGKSDLITFYSRECMAERVRQLSRGTGEFREMAEICPFRGIRYNQGIFKDLDKVICPPYDVIAPERQRIYYEMSDYNAIRLEHGIEQPWDNATDNKYSRAAVTFEQWLKEGVLQVEEQPAFYLHDHYFAYLGEKKKRRGLIARVRLEQWGDGIYPHEETFSKAKSDRLQLMRACQANFSPLLALYQDSSGEVVKILSETSQDEPVMELANSDEGHTVWAVTEPKFVQRISELLVAQPLHMADGHHRYETALAYQEERARKLACVNRKEAFNYVMMSLVDFSDPGLVILSISRLVRGIAPSVLAELENRLGKLFTLEYIPLDKDLIDRLKRGVIAGAFLGVLGLKPQFVVALRQRQDAAIVDMLPGSHSQAYRNLNVGLLTDTVLGGMLGLAPDSGNIAYTADIDEVCQQIEQGTYQLAFLLSPPRPEMVKAVADAKDKMPRKSTYFYPKLPAGLIINSLDQL